MTTKATVSHKLLEKNTNAKFLANLVNGSEEWLDLRQTGIGGSDVATILGFSKWSSPYSLWADKTRAVERPNISSEPMEWGNRLEPVILDKFEEVHPEYKLIRDVGTWHHPEREWQLANPDAVFEYFEEDPSAGEDQNTTHYGIVEVKTAGREDDWRDGVPRYYETQVQWYLSTFGFSKAIVVVLFHGNMYREFEIAANEFQQQVAIEAVSNFREYILNGTAPDFDGANSTYETVRLQHPEINDDESIELDWMGISFLDAESKYRAAETEFTLAKTHVMSAMGKAKRGTVNGDVIVQRQARGSGTPFLVIKKGTN